VQKEELINWKKYKNEFDAFKLKSFFWSLEKIAEKTHEESSISMNFVLKTAYNFY
jgi:hypothetical protein